MKFTIGYESLGLPSCAFVEMSSPKIKYKYTIGTFGDITQCTRYFKNQPYNGPYVLNETTKIWSFKQQAKKLGKMTIKFNLTNDMSEVVFKRTVAVAWSLECKPPVVSIVNQSANFFAPTEIKKTEMIVVESTTALRCSGNLNHVKKWSIFEIDPVTVEEIRLVELIDNPTQDYGQLVIQPGVLDYGLYKFVFSAKMDVEIYESEVSHFVKVIPTGVVIFSMKGGIAEITRGIKQEVVLDPVSYSFDFDNLISSRDLTYYFYCQTIDNGFPNGFPMASFTEKIDLLSFQKGLAPNFPMSFNKTCFATPDSFLFDETEKILTILPNSLKFYKNRIYQFMISASYLGTVYSQKTNLILKNVGAVPKVELK